MRNKIQPKIWRLCTNVGLILLLVFVVSSCYKEVVIEEGLDDWTTETHSKYATLNYNIVFNRNMVQRFDIVIEDTVWNSMQQDLQAYINEGGVNSGRNPVYVPCQLFFDGIQWYNVGIRYKGKSSLTDIFDDGIGKLPFRLSFDEFEDIYPIINDQTFYGFEELSLNNNYKDESFVKEKIASDIFTDFGIPSARAAYYEIYIDFGEGSTYFGLYTALEVVEKSTLINQFGSKNGNCYKPEGQGASWAMNGFTVNDFEKRTNELESDWSDIQSMYSQIHSSNRTSNLTQYQNDLEAIFDVDGFLKYLAANTTIQNWDSYGVKARNYYLYNDPSDGLIKWIPWDYNEAFELGNSSGSLSFEFGEVNNSEWPLIGYLVNIPSYRAKYDNYVEEFIEDIFNPSRMTASYNQEKTLIESSVLSESDEYTLLDNSAEFTSAISDLITHCSERKTAAENYLD